MIDVKLAKLQRKAEEVKRNLVKTAFFAKDVRCLLEKVPFLLKTLGIKKYRPFKAVSGG